MYPTLDIPNFLTKFELAKISKRVYNTCNEKTDLVDKWGVWKGNLVTTQYWVPSNQLDFVFSEIKKKKTKILDPFIIEKGQILESHLAYDLHTDYYIKVNHEAEELVGNPYYTLIVPLEDFQSHTVVFEQSADYNDFYLYKERNQPLEQFISDEDWQKYCSHCWPEDQQYVTIEKAVKWTQGKLIGFDRKKFHCSDNFTKELEQKRAFVLWIRHY